MTDLNAEKVKVEREARLLADESFRHSWDMSDERRIDGAWVAGLCCECGEFVPYGQEVEHLAAAFAPLIAKAQADALREAAGTYLHTYPEIRDDLRERADALFPPAEGGQG